MTSNLSNLDIALAAVQGLNRREVLRRVAALVAAGAAGTAAGPLHAAGTPAMKHMGPEEAAVFLRVAQVVLPTEGTPLASWTPEGLLGTLDAALLAGMAPHVLAGLREGVRYFDQGPQSRFGRRFTALDDADAARFLDDWGDAAEPPHRALSMGLKKLVQLSYWANPATWEPIGYPGPMTRARGLPSLGNTPMPRA